jgi:hypothetical protein
MAAGDLTKTLFPAMTIAAAVTGRVGEVHMLPHGVTSLSAQGTFLYGAGGTTCKAWLQTSLDGGATWIDIANFAYTTAAARTVHSVKTNTVVAANYVATDGTLADNTIKDGILGDRIRVKVTTTGTYSGASSVSVTAIAR